MKILLYALAIIVCILHFNVSSAWSTDYFLSDEPNCTNKINLFYYDKISGKVLLGCFNSVDELRNDKDKIEIKYSVSGMSYFPLKIALPDYDLNYIQAMQAGKCATFSVDEVRACFLYAVNTWNSICPSRQIEIVALDDHAHVVVRVSEKISDFSNSEPTNITLARTTLSPRLRYTNGVVTEAYWHRDERSHQPTLLINMTNEVLRNNIIWTTDCPCDGECQGTCISICSTLLHEIAHLYGVLHQDACMQGDVNYDEYAIMHQDTKPCNANSPRYYDVCNRALRTIDKCIFCKTLCPDRCSAIVSVESMQMYTESPSTFDVYPNPTRAVVTVRNKSKLFTSFTCTLYGSNGIKIVDCSGSIGTQNEITIDFNLLGVCKGEYFLVIKNEFNYSVHRIRII